MKKTRQRINVNLDELDRIIDHGTQTPLSESDGQKLKGALHALAEVLTPTRNNEKTNAVLPDTAGETSEDKAPEKKPKPGHGRNGASAFKGAENIAVPHAQLKSGDRCPDCEQGKVYVQKEPKPLVRVIGQAPLTATVYNLERLRCNGCGQVFTAQEPEGIETGETISNRYRVYWHYWMALDYLSQVFPSFSSVTHVHRKDTTFEHLKRERNGRVGEEQLEAQRDTSFPALARCELVAEFESFLALRDREGLAEECQELLL